MLELLHVHKSYKKHPAVIDLSFTVQPGEIIGMLGPNGAGKSTTISMIATLLKPDSGKIMFHGTDITKHPEVIRAKLGFVPQDITLYEPLTGKDNLLFWAGAYHIDKNVQADRIDKVSEMIGFTSEMLHQPVKEYSGGMKRRLNIGVALLHDPELILLDEPTQGIDLQSRKQILEAIQKLKKEGKSVIYVGHYMEETEKLCDRILMMDKGQCILNASLSDALKGQGKMLTLEQLYEMMYMSH